MFPIGAPNETISLLPPVTSPTSEAPQLLELTLDADVGPLTSTLLTFLKVMNDQDAPGSINPRELFDQLCEKYPCFQG